jgi:hypothetical protein
MTLCYALCDLTLIVVPVLSSGALEAESWDQEADWGASFKQKSSKSSYS